jgi:hypothetical protein
MFGVELDANLLNDIFDGVIYVDAALERFLVMENPSACMNGLMKTKGHIREV